MTENNLQNLTKKIKECPKIFNIYEKELSLNKFSNLKKFPKKTIIIKDSWKLCNDGFPSKFNLSVSEQLWSEWCKKNNGIIKKGVFDYTKVPEHSFWTIVPCSREEDFDKILSGSKQHLMLFHIALTNGCHVIKKDKKIIEKYFESFIEFLIKNGLNPKKLTISVFPGGKINNHGIIKKFPEDHNSKLINKLSMKYGFKVKNTEDQTFLSLRIFGSPIFWGYRNEFFYNYEGIEWDIGTIEYLPYKPIYKVDNEGFVSYKKIVDSKFVFLGGGIGLERVLLILEGKKEILELSSIKPLANIIKKHTKNKSPNEKSVLLIEEILRLMHHLVCEVGGLNESNLGNRNRKTIVSKLRTALVASILSINLNFTESFLEEFLKENIKQNSSDEKVLKIDKKIIQEIAKEINERLRMYSVSEQTKKDIDEKIIRYKLK
ncbi:MAG: hypothetical protein AABX03_03300 [Nanoarchaeota archaeon]